MHKFLFQIFKFAKARWTNKGRNENALLAFMLP